MSANALHLAPEAFLSISLHLLNNIVHDLDLPVIDETWHLFDALNLYQHVRFMKWISCNPMVLNNVDLTVAPHQITNGPSSNEPCTREKNAQDFVYITLHSNCAIDHWARGWQ